MKKIFLLDDDDKFRRFLKKEITSKVDNSSVKEYDNTIGNDVLLVENVLNECEGSSDEIIAVIDVNFFTNWDKWIRDENLLNQENAMWYAEFNTYGGHGFNMVEAIRYKSKKVRIVTISAWEPKSLARVRNHKPLPKESFYYKHIPNNEADFKVAKKLIDFINLTE